MKLLALLLIANIASAANMNCDITEIFNDQDLKTSIAVPITDDPHGSVQMFQLQHFTKFSGMLAYMKDYAVIHLYNEDGFAFTTHADLSGKGMAFYQIYMPGGGAVQISCSVEK